MEKWFFINISSINISDGYPDFYFGATQENCYYFKQKFPTELQFEEILLDRVAAILIKDRVPDYNLVFLVSKPLTHLLPEIDKNEKAITPLVYYLDQKIKELSEFLEEKNPMNKYIFELDEKVGPQDIGVHKSKYENIHYLDHQKPGTPYYKIAASWPDGLKKFLQNTKIQSNLQYLVNVKNIYFCRLSLYQKRHEDYLHLLFSFLQLFITESNQFKINIFSKNTLNELDFEGNGIESYFKDFCRQVNTSLDDFKRKIGEHTKDDQLIVAEKNENFIKDALKGISSKLSSYQCSTENLDCSNAGDKIKKWEKDFTDFTKGIPRSLHDFELSLNNKANIISVNKKTTEGNQGFWRGKEIDFQEEHKSLSDKITSIPFNENTFTNQWRVELSKRFTELQKDVQRCPSQPFMLTILLISLAFYSFASYTILSKVTNFSDYLLFFLVITLIYFAISLFLFFKYRKESINKIKQKIRSLEAFNQARVTECMEGLKQKAENQLKIYQLGVLNQNLSICEESLMHFKELDHKIETIRRRNVNINSIADIKNRRKDFELTREVKEVPNSIDTYIKVFDSKFEEVTIKHLLNGLDQNKDIKKFSNRNNALKAIKINQT